MPAKIEIEISDPGGGRGGGGSGGGGGGAGGGGGGGNPPRYTQAERDEQTLIRVQRSADKRLQQEAEQNERTLARVSRSSNKKLERQSQQKQKQQEQDDLTLIRQQRAADQKLRREAQQKQKQQERDDLTLIRVQRQAEAKLRQQREQKQREEQRREEEEMREARAQGARYAQVASAALGGSTTRGKFRGTGAAVGAPVGTAVGTAAGAAIGGPVGAAIGGALGSVVGQVVGEKIGDYIFDPFQDVITKPMKALGRAVDVAGAGLTRVAGNDAIGAFTTGLDAASEGLEDIPFVGAATSATLGTLSKSLKAAEQVVGAFANRAREISGFSGNIAGAAARQDVARMMTDIREAQRLGRDYAKVVDAQAKMEATLSAGLIPLKEAVMQWLPRIAEIITNIAIAAAIMADKADILDISNGLFKEMAEEMVKVRRMMEDAMPGGGDPLNMMGMLDAIGGVAAPPAPAPAGGFGPGAPIAAGGF